MESYPRKRRTTLAFKNIAESFLKYMDQLFDICCKDTITRTEQQEK